MCSLEEANEAYRYIGLPGYNPHVKKDVFFKYHDATVARDAIRLDNSLKKREAALEAATSTSLTENIIDFSPLGEKCKNNYLPSPKTSVPSTKTEITNDNAISDKEKILLINSRRVFHIAEEGRSYQEREDLARTYFDQVMAVEINPENYKNQTLLLQIYIANKTNRDYISPNIYGFRPIKVNSYLFHRLIKNGFLCGTYTDLKKTIDWSYLPLSVPSKEEVHYICSASYFKRKLRKRLSEELLKKIEKTEDKYKTDYNWVYWPDLD